MPYRPGEQFTDVPEAGIARTAKPDLVAPHVVIVSPETHTPEAIAAVAEDDRVAAEDRAAAGAPIADTWAARLRGYVDRASDAAGKVGDALASEAGHIDLTEVTGGDTSDLSPRQRRERTQRRRQRFARLAVAAAVALPTAAVGVPALVNGVDFSGSQFQRTIATPSDPFEAEPMSETVRHFGDDIEVQLSGREIQGGPLGTNRGSSEGQPVPGLDFDERTGVQPDDISRQTAEQQEGLDVGDGGPSRESVEAGEAPAPAQGGNPGPMEAPQGGASNGAGNQGSNPGPQPGSAQAPPFEGEFTAAGVVEGQQP